MGEQEEQVGYLISVYGSLAEKESPCRPIEKGVPWGTP